MNFSGKKEFSGINIEVLRSRTVIPVKGRDAAFLAAMKWDSMVLVYRYDIF